MLVAPAAPVPAQPPVPAAKADRFKALEFARVVCQVGEEVAAQYVKPVEVKELIAAAARGMYEECGLPVPDRVLKAIHDAGSSAALVDTLADVRLLLANQPALRGPRALVAAINGFRHATEPLCQLTSPRASTFASVDMDFGIGIELEGAGGVPWMVYQVEYKVALGHHPPVGWLDPVPRPDAVNAPAAAPWRLKRVIPESPAQKAGIKPGDVITHFNGKEVTAESANKLFPQFAFPAQLIDPRTGRPVPPDRTLTFRRGPGRPFSVNIKGEPYTPASAFGVVRTNEDKWDCMLERAYMIGYVRLGAVELHLDDTVGAMLAELDKKGCRALILDLRWCPGGYIDPAVGIAGAFLPDRALIARMKYRVPNAPGNDPELRAPPGLSKYTTYPLVVLVGNETLGGGELMAAALRDHDRCVLMGQRTVGRAATQYPIEGGFGDLQFKVTTGTASRINGKARQRLPDSGPLDDWGVKPDAGLEVPVTLGKSAELRRGAELHAIRPFDSDEALDFDDPAQDPYRLKALDYLRKKIGKPHGAK